MLDKIQLLLDLDEVTITTNTLQYTDVKLLNADKSTVCFLDGDVKVYVSTKSIQSLKHK